MVVKYQHDRAGDGDARVFKLFIGRLVHSKSLKNLEVLPHAVIGVEPDGTIAFVHESNGSTEVIREHYLANGFDEVPVVQLKPSQFFFPGMVDTHLHAPQWPNLALGMEGTLREWVENWTDPIEVS
jgi:guanine deaminase